MPKRNIMLAYPMANGYVRDEVCGFITHAAVRAEFDDRVLELFRRPITRFPTDIARNIIVSEARKYDCELLVMIDDDMAVPVGYWDALLNFYFARPTGFPSGPFVMGVPYCTAPPDEQVTVFEWTAKRSAGAGRDKPHFNLYAHLKNVPREAAARRTGIERVANIGTGCIAYTMDCFDRIEKPYYEYGYNEDHTNLTETEDCACHRKMAFADIPIYVNWDFWASHWKAAWIDKPYVITMKDTKQFFVDQARADVREELKAEQREQEEAENKVVMPSYESCGPVEANPSRLNGAMPRPNHAEC